MTAPNECLQRRVYNVTAMSFTPEELVEKLYKYVPELRVTYKPDSRQNIGKTSPHTFYSVCFVFGLVFFLHKLHWQLKLFIFFHFSSPTLYRKKDFLIYHCFVFLFKP